MIHPQSGATIRIDKATIGLLVEFCYHNLLLFTLQVDRHRDPVLNIPPLHCFMELDQELVIAKDSLDI